MRLTSDYGHFTAGLRRINDRLASYQIAQERLASGKRMQRPSDDVAGTARSMALRASLSVRSQEARNAEDGLMWISLADTKLQGAVGALQRTRELAVRGATFTSADEREGIAVEVEGIRDELLALANSRQQSRGLFAGYALDDAVTKVAGVWTFTGDAGVVERRVAEGEVVAVNVTADDVFGFNAGADVFTMLDDLATRLRAGDTPGIDASIAEIDAGLDRVLDGLTRLGTAANRIEEARGRNADDVLAIQGQLSEVEDVDFAEAIMDLQLQEMAYQAALTAFAAAGQASLMDFMQ